MTMLYFCKHWWSNVTISSDLHQLAWLIDLITDISFILLIFRLL